MDLVSQLRFSKSSLIVCGLVSFLVGLALARLKIQVFGFEVWFSLGIVCLIGRSKNLISLIAVIIFGLLLGLWRGQIYMHKLEPYQTLMKQGVTIIGQVESNGVYERLQLSFDLANLKVQHPYQASLVGKIGVRGYGFEF